MSDKPVISIIIPHFKRHEHLYNALDAIARQDYPAGEIEVIVVEDDSALGNTHGLSATFSFAQFIQCFAHIGAAGAKNLGAKRARGEWLVFLDDDIELDPHWLTAMMAAARSTSEVKCFQSKVLSHDDPEMLKSTGGVANEFGYAWDRGVFEKDLRQYDLKKEILFASSCAMLVRKDLFDRAGGFDKDLFYMGEDHDLGLRLHMLGERVQYVPEALCKHADKGCDRDEILRQKYFIERNRILIVFKNYEGAYLMTLLGPMLVVKIFKYISYLFRFKRKKLGYAGDVIKGWAWIIAHIPLILRKRREVARLRTRSVRSILRDFEEYRCYLASVGRDAA